MDAVPPGPEVKKGAPADPDSGTNMALAAINDDHVEPTACGWVCTGIRRSGCPGFVHIGALRVALAPWSPPSTPVPTPTLHTSRHIFHAVAGA